MLHTFSQLETAEMEDRIRFDSPDAYPIEIQTRVYTALVQDASLKKEAAIVVNESYKKILSVMKQVYSNIRYFYQYKKVKWQMKM